MINREPRKSTFIQARMLTDAGWCDATIRNLSSGGMMLEMAGGAPRRGSYVELRRTTSVLVGRVAWSAANRCGISTRERIDIAALERGKGADAVVAGSDRRLVPRRNGASPYDAATIGRLIEAAVLGIALVIASLALAFAVYHFLERVSNQIIDASGPSADAAPPALETQAPSRGSGSQ
ncbi:PilZ domain-containing protein [Sphingomonas baiyangensis]|uniref:PilZ domain-containing protein n=1 Tax=Sphingomonas baiyangensis TaxID=2572576 RepID=A0A4U1L4W5_9SPHN|nr:PilZ domain-containing protein [Sphingomonas baiyangensis]TKD51594.1 PilZ domain-containing protein [Sphingomonas baiyangensis]